MYLDQSSYTVTEDKSVTVTVRVNRLQDQDLVVDLGHTSGTAVAGTHYDAPPATVTIPGGQNRFEVTASFDIRTKWDADESDKNFTLFLTGTNLGHVSLCSPWTAGVTVEGVEVPTVRVTGRNPRSPWYEGQSLRFGVWLWPVQPWDVMVNLDVADASGGSDFLWPHQEGRRTVRIDAGSIGKTVVVSTVNDSTAEPDGSVTATVAAGNRYELHATEASRTLPVADNDGTSSFVSTMTLGAPDKMQLAEGPRQGREQAGGRSGGNPHANAAVLKLSSSGSFRQGLVRLLVDVGGTATYGEDYVLQVWDPDLSQRWYDLPMSGYEPGQVAWVVMARDSWLRAVALADRVGDTPETVTLAVADWNTTQQFHPAAQVDVSANATHTLTIGTDVVPVVNDDPESPDPGDGLTKVPQDTDDADAAEPPLVKYAALIKSFYDRISDKNQHGDGAAGGWNKRFLKAMGHPEYVDYPQAAVTAERAQELYDHGGPGANTAWAGTVDAIRYKTAYDAGQLTPEPANPPPPDPDPEPEITIGAGSGVTEGTAASFTLNASPAPTSAVTVQVGVTAAGSYGVTTGTRDIVVPASGTVTFTVPTVGDDVDEPDGSATATVQAGSGYTVGTPAAGTVAIADDDDPPTPTVDNAETALAARVEQLRDDYSAYADWATGSYHQYMVHYSTGEILALLNADTPAANSVSNQALFFRAIRAAKGARDNNAAVLFAEVRDHYSIKKIG